MCIFNKVWRYFSKKEFFLAQKLDICYNFRNWINGRSMRSKG